MAEKTIEEVEAEIKRIQLETATIQLEQARETNEQYKATKEARGRQNRQRQGQLKADLTERASIITSCTHRQGGSPGRERKGKGPSALRVVVLPDNRTLIMCANCPMRVFSPLASDRNPERRPGESALMARTRVARYAEDVQEYDELLEKAREQLTPEAAQEMHCGKTFAFVSGDGNQVTVPAPCDSYAQGRDNRQVAVAG